jgi:2,3-diketo-5-methylthio-1-phosphopentane phosphatase
MAYNTTKPIQVFCDFDGTISRDDVTDLLLKTFASSQWEEIEEDWKLGRIGSIECLTKQIGLLHASVEEVEAFVADLKVDQTFSCFVRFCNQSRINLEILSDGLDLIIHKILKREGISVQVRANHFVSTDRKSWSLETPYSFKTCKSNSAHCKCASAGLLPNMFTILIGDGQSDICLSAHVDMVFAKQTNGSPSCLLQHCRKEGLSHSSFETFSEVTEKIMQLTQTPAADYLM